MYFGLLAIDKFKVTFYFFIYMHFGEKLIAEGNRSILAVFCINLL